MHGELVKAELEDEILKGKGCIVFDFACYFPYFNQEDLFFDFQLSENTIDNIKLNHRYPNHSYVTISRKNGRKISKLGYPYFMDLSNTPRTLFLVIKTGLEGEYLTNIFPLQVSLTHEHPVCALSMRFMFDKARFDFFSYYKCDDGIGWHKKYWSNQMNAINQMKAFSEVDLGTPTKIDDSTLLWSVILDPIPQTLDNLMI